ncbi:MAG: uncharacterized protein A8A55_2173 [Amphiamblys sp. WSBS2006]|nr:MAG: uncharacterized protein A8A55_2173 [Amphiamblys sp. WSBS2006]
MDAEEETGKYFVFQEEPTPVFDLITFSGDKDSNGDNTLHPAETENQVPQTQTIAAETDTNPEEIHPQETEMLPVPAQHMPLQQQTPIKQTAAEPEKENTEAAQTPDVERKTNTAVPVYSQTDIEKIIQKTKEKGDYENRMLLQEIQLLEHKYEAILSVNTELSLKKHEHTRLEDEIQKHFAEKGEYQTAIEKLLHQKQQLQIDLTAMHSSFHDLRMRYDDGKRINTQLQTNEREFRNIIAGYKKELETQERKFQALRTHAEEKLQEANRELQKKTVHTDSDVLLLKTKLQRAEARNSHLEKLLESKEKENKELLSICDELMKKF